jgi:hypothetical protein
MKECKWLKPTIVAQFEFVEWTPDGHLRDRGTEQRVDGELVERAKGAQDNVENHPGDRKPARPKLLHKTAHIPGGAESFPSRKPDAPGPT